jgi:hypothetical protein
LKRDDIEKRVKSFIDTALLDPKTFILLLGDSSNEEEEANMADLERNQKQQAKIRAHRAESLKLLVEKVIGKEDFAELDAGYQGELEPLVIEEKKLIEEQEVDPIELQGYEQMLHDQASYLAEGGSEQDFKSNVDYGFYVEAMDLRIEVSPRAERVSASAIGVVNALLPNVTDKNMAPASASLNGKRFLVIFTRPLGAATN